MTGPAQAWSRPAHAPGGGDAFLFYVVFGVAPGSLEISRSTYRFRGVPQGIDVQAYGPDQATVVRSFRTGPLWTDLGARRPSLAASVAAADSCVVVVGTVPDPQDLLYLRDVVGLVTSLLDRGAVAVLDPQGFAWWEPVEWRREIFELDGADPHRHVIILTSEDGPGTKWFHTRGLRKFGRPDVSLHGVTPAREAAATELCNRFIGLQAFGGIVPEGQEIRMAGLPEGAVCRHRGTLEDPDFNNVHLEIEWPPLAL